MKRYAIWRTFLRMSPTLLAVGLLALWAGMMFGRNSISASDDAELLPTPPDASTAPPDLEYVVDPHKVVGHEQCVDCHQAETASWLVSKHALTAFDELRTSPSSREYAEKLDIPFRDMATKSICVTCHATPQVDNRGRMRVIAGISCEACHNASGGEDGWLNLHAVYGPTGTHPENETPSHHARRKESCRRAGQYRAADVYQLAKQCFGCHIVSDEKLVNVAGHKTGDSNGFEFVSWSMGEVRHNSHLDQGQNAEASTLWMDPLWRASGAAGTPAERKRLMYIAGFLADLEVSLRNRAKATEEGDFADAMNGRIENARDELEAIIEETEVELPAVRRAVEAVESIIDEYLEEIDPDQSPVFIDAAKNVAASASKFVETHDGSNLGALDEYGLPEIPAEARGPVFEP